MRWERLIAELAAGAELEQRAELLAEAADRARREVARVSLDARLRAADGRAIEVVTDTGLLWRGTLRSVGSGWLLLESDGRELLVATGHLASVGGLPAAAASAPSAARRRVYEGMDLRHALRGVAADRSAVGIHTHPGEPLTGTIDRVGSDFIDVAVHAIGEQRRAASVAGHRTVLTAAIRAVVRSAG